MLLGGQDMHHFSMSIHMIVSLKCMIMITISYVQNLQVLSAIDLFTGFACAVDVGVT